MSNETALIFIEYSNIEDILRDNKRIIEDEQIDKNHTVHRSDQLSNSYDSETANKTEKVFNSKILAAILSTKSGKQSTLESDVYFIALMRLKKAFIKKIPIKINSTVIVAIRGLNLTQSSKRSVLVKVNVSGMPPSGMA